MPAMKPHWIILAMSLVLALCACQKPVEQSVDDLASADAAVRQKAVERLATDGEAVVAKLASGLSSDSADEIAATFEVLRRLGVKAQPQMVEKIGYIWRNKQIHDGFVDFFRSLGDDGYLALVTELLRVAELAGNEANADGSMVKLESFHHRFESVSLVLEGLTNSTDVGQIPTLLHNPYSKIRTRAAYLLCLKGYVPEDATDRVVYFTHLATTLDCATVPEPVEEAAQLAAENLKAYLAAEETYPAPSNARYRVLAAAGTDAVADYVYDQAVATDNEFMLFNLFDALKKMDNDAGRTRAKKLLNDSKRGRSIRSLDPNAAQGL